MTASRNGASRKAGPRSVKTVVVERLLLTAAVIVFARAASGAPCAYVSAGFGTDAGRVVVVDTDGGKVVTAIPLGDDPQGLALTPDGRRLYAVNAPRSSLDTADVAVIDATTNQVVLSIPVGNFTTSLSMSPDGRYALTFNKCGLDTSCASPPSIAVIRVDKDQLIGQIFGQQVIPDIDCRLNALAITPDSTRAYVACLKRGQVGVVDLQSFDRNPGCIQCAFTGFMTVTDNTFLPVAVATSPDGSRLYVASRGASTNRLSVVDTSTKTVVANVDFAPSDDGIDPAVAVATTGSPVYIGRTSFQDGDGQTRNGLLAIDPDTNSPLGGVVLQGSSVVSMAFTTDGARAYVAGGSYVGAYGVDVVDVAAGASSFLSLAQYGATRGIAISSNDQCPPLPANTTPTPSFTATPLPTATGTRTSTATQTGTRTSTPTLTQTVTQAATVSMSPSATSSASLSVPTGTATRPVLPTSTTRGSLCPGDCGSDGAVTINDLIRAVNIGLGSLPVTDCRAADRNGDGAVSISELIAAVNAALGGCPV